MKDKKNQTTNKTKLPVIHTILEISSKSKFITFKRLLLVCLGALLFAFNLNTFVANTMLLPGGFTGLAKLIQHVFTHFLNINLPFSPLYFLLNAVPAFISFKYIGKNFTLYSCLMILLSGIFTDILPQFSITDDILLSSIFGGVLNAVAISLCLFAGATSGGSDFIAIYISEKYGKDAWDYIFVGNVIILGISGMLFTWEGAMYSMIFQFSSTQVLNVLYKRYQQVTLLIITDNAEKVYKLIKSITNHDATLFEGTGTYTQQKRQMVYSVVSADECRKLTKEIKKEDPGAFINKVESKQILGNFYRKPND